MKLKFIDPATLDKNLKATIHHSGKIGFTKNAAAAMGLTNEVSAKIGINDDDEQDESLYIVMCMTIEPSAFKVNKAGEYFYMATKPLFDKMGLDYVRFNYVYDISRIESDGKEVFKLKRRFLTKK